MAVPKTPIQVDKSVHVLLKGKLRNTGVEMTTVVTKLIEMFVRGEVKIVVPEKQL